MTSRLSLQQVLGALLQLQGKEQAAGFGTCRVTAGPTPTTEPASASQSCEATEAIPSKPVKFPSSGQAAKSWGHTHS